MTDDVTEMDLTTWHREAFDWAHLEWSWASRVLRLIASLRAARTEATTLRAERDRLRKGLETIRDHSHNCGVAPSFAASVLAGTDLGSGGLIPPAPLPLAPEPAPEAGGWPDSMRAMIREAGQRARNAPEAGGERVLADLRQEVEWLRNERDTETRTADYYRNEEAKRRTERDEARRDLADVTRVLEEARARGRDLYADLNRNRDAHEATKRERDDARRERDEWKTTAEVEAAANAYNGNAVVGALSDLAMTRRELAACQHEHDLTMRGHADALAALVAERTAHEATRARVAGLVERLRRLVPMMRGDNSPAAMAYGDCLLIALDDAAKGGGE